jgi:hypothetical protein
MLASSSYQTCPRSSKFSDVYGCSIVLCRELLERSLPGLETTQIILRLPMKTLHPPIPQDCPWKDLMVQMLGRKSIGAARNSSEINGRAECNIKRGWRSKNSTI